MAKLSVRAEAEVFYLGGEFDMAELEVFAKGTDAVLDGKGPVILDLRELTFIDSSGLNAIASLASWCDSRGLILRNAPPFVARVLAIVNLDQHLAIAVETRNGAVDGPGAWSVWAAAVDTYPLAVARSRSLLAQSSELLLLSREAVRRSKALRVLLDSA